MSLVDIAEAVRAAYAAGYGAEPRRISQNIGVARTYENRPKLDDLKPWTPGNTTPGIIKVFVSPAVEALVTEECTRDTLIYDYSIIIGLQAKPVSKAVESIDPLHALRQELKDYFFKLDPAYALPGRLEGAIGQETIDDMDQQEMRTKGVFLADFVITFRGGRPR